MCIVADADSTGFESRGKSSVDRCSVNTNKTALSMMQLFKDFTMLESCYKLGSDIDSRIIRSFDVRILN